MPQSPNISVVEYTVENPGWGVLFPVERGSHRGIVLFDEETSTSASTRTRLTWRVESKPLFGAGLIVAALQRGVIGKLAGNLLKECERKYK